jgi:hypothetical protein
MRKYKSNYRTHRNVKRFAVSFDAPPATPSPRATLCEDCGGKIEEVMTVNRCFRCEGIRRRAQTEQAQTAPRLENLGTHVIISGGEVLELGKLSPDHEGNYDSDYSSWMEDPY